MMYAERIRKGLKDLHVLLFLSAMFIFGIPFSMAAIKLNWPIGAHALAFFVIMIIVAFWAILANVVAVKCRVLKIETAFAIGLTALFFVLGYLEAIMLKNNVVDIIFCVRMSVLLFLVVCGAICFPLFSLMFAKGR